MFEGFSLKRLVAYAILVLGALVFAYPFIWMALATFKPEVELNELTVFPQKWSVESFELVFRTIPIGRAFLNSVIVVLGVTVSALVFGSMAAYSLSKLEWKGRDSIFNILMFRSANTPRLA